MRKTTLFLLAATVAAMPATAQANATAPTGIAGPEANMATNATGEATANGLAADPGLTTPAAPPALEDPAATDATVTPETGEGGGGFPWGLLGLLGLAGLIGRFRS